MAVRSKGDAEQLRRLARALYFGNETIEWFLASSSAAQLRAVSDLIGYEMDVRERNKRSRLYRRAKFPQVKSFDGYDFSQVAFPDGYGVDDLKSRACRSSMRPRTSCSMGRPGAARRTWPSRSAAHA